jgi:hypothetical protein
MMRVKIARFLCARLWALPATLIGLVALPLALLGGGRVRLVHGVIEAHGGLLAHLLRHGVPIARGAAAMTVGHIVLGRNDECLTACRDHERVHVRQYERWGPFFLPAYFLASAIAALGGGHYYRDNWFERAAFRAQGDS